MSTYRKKKHRKRVEKIQPEQQLLLDELREAFQKLGVEVKLEPGYFRGGYCIIEDKPYFYLNKNHRIEQHIDLLIAQLKKVDTSGIYLSPRLRTYLEKPEIITEG